MNAQAFSPSAFAQSLVGISFTFLPEDVLRPDRPVQTIEVLEFLPDAAISQTETGPAFRVSISYVTKKNSFIKVERTLGFKRFGDYMALAIQQEGQHQPVVKPIKEEVVPAEALVEDKAGETLTERKPNRKERKAAEKKAKAEVVVLEDVPAVEGENIDEYLDALAAA